MLDIKQKLDNIINKQTNQKTTMLSVLGSIELCTVQFLYVNCECQFEREDEVYLTCC